MNDDYEVIDGEEAEYEVETDEGTLQITLEDDETEEAITEALDEIHAVAQTGEDPVAVAARNAAEWAARDAEKAKKPDQPTAQELRRINYH